MWTRLSIPPLLIPTSFDVNNIPEYEKNRKKTHGRDNGYTIFLSIIKKIILPLLYYFFYDNIKICITSTIFFKTNSIPNNQT